MKEKIKEGYREMIDWKKARIGKRKVILTKSKERNVGWFEYPILYCVISCTHLNLNLKS